MRDYVGKDPVTGKERVLRETCPDEAEAAAALARLLKQADGHQAPSRNILWLAPPGNGAVAAMYAHPSGAGAAADDFNVSFDPEADLPGVAAVGGAFAATVSGPAALPVMLKEALAAVHSGRPAVVAHVPKARGA